MRYTNRFAGTTAVSVAGMTLLAVAAFAQGQNAGGDGPPVLARISHSHLEIFRFEGIGEFLRLIWVYAGRAELAGPNSASPD